MEMYRKMKICMFLDNPISRDPRVKGEAQALAKAGHDVTVVGTMGKDTPAFEEWEGVKFERIDVTASSGAKTLAGIKALPAIFKGKDAFLAKCKTELVQSTDKLYIKKVAGRGFDIFHANDLVMLPPAAKAAKAADAKLVYDSHEYFRMDYFTKGKSLPKAIEEHFKVLLERQAKYIKEADLVVTVCDNIANAIKNDHSLAETPLVIYNTAKLRERQRMNILREEYLHTSDDRPIVLYQGMISYGRGLEQFIGLAKGNPEADFVIIGPSSKKAFYDKLVDASKDLHNVYFLDPVPYEKLWQITVSADYGFTYLEPMNASYEMAAGNKLFEYLAAGLPIFTRGSMGTLEICGKIEECFGKEKQPLLVLPEKEEEQPAFIHGVITSGDWQKFSDTAYEVAKTLFNQDLEFRKLTQAYAKLETK